MLPKLLVIVGPTASGKTALGIALAKQYNGEVISADSRLVFRGMDIGTAKPPRDLPLSKEEPLLSLPLVRGGHVVFTPEKPYVVEGVPHWGIDLVNPDEDFNVSQYKTYAEARIKEIVARGKLPIVVGGTGLWVDALVDNLSIPEVPPNPAIRAELESRSVDDLFAEYKRLDPVGAEVIDRYNPRRLVRAIEVCRVTGKPFSAAQVKGKPKYDVLKIGIDVDKETLASRIDQRVDEMIANGLVNEVRELWKKYGTLDVPLLSKEGIGVVVDPVALTGIGYRQIAFFLAGKANLAAAIDDVKRDTRAYAKRQLTWFRRDERIHWITKPEEAAGLVETFVYPQTNG